MKSAAQHPLLTRLSGVGSSLRRTAMLAVLLRMLALVILAALLIGLIDYLLRLEDRGLRVISTGLVWAAVGYAGVRLVDAVRRSRRNAVAVAQRVEQHFSALGDRLSSAVAFLEQDEDDPLAGSATLRRSVINEVTDDVAQLRLMRAVDRTQLSMAARYFAVVVAALAMLVVVGGEHVSIAARRLANPLGDLDWPRTNHLEFVDPVAQMAAGASFEALLIDQRGILPDDVMIHYRYRRGRSWVEESEPMRRSDAAMIAVRDNVRESFEFRASGGDDDSMQWQPVQVVNPPTLASLDVTIHPPAYTGYLPYRGERPIHALARSGIELRGVATSPLSHAAAVLETGRRVPADLAADRKTFKIPPDRWQAEETLPYRWELANADGFAAADDSELLRVTDDPPPTVAFELPAPQEFVTPQATLPLKLIVKDNLAVHKVELVIRRSPEVAGRVERLDVYRQDEPPQHAADQSPLVDDGQRLIVQQMWELAPLELTPGEKLSVEAVAVDFRPGESRSGSPRIIHIISAVELQQRLAGQQDFILSQLAQAVDQLRTAREDTQALSIELEQDTALPADFLQQAQSIDLMQRGVEATLVDPGEGLLAEVRRLLGEVERNQADAEELKVRMQDLETELKRLAGGPLPEIREQLTAAMKIARGDDSSGQVLSTRLADTALKQTEIVDALQAKLGNLAQWAGFKQFARDVAQLQLDQQQLAETTREVGLEILDADPQQATQDDDAIQRIARSQTALARRLDVTARRMQDMVEQVAEEEPVAADTLADALHRSRQLGIAQAMRQAAQQVRDGQVGQALRNQDRAAEDLQEVLDTLRNRREQELDRLLEKIVAAEQDLAELAEQVEDHQDELEEAAQERTLELERLLREQETLEASLERMARRLERLDAEQAAESTTRAATQLRQAQQATAGATEAEGAADPATRARRAAQAEQDLEAARQQLAKKRRAVEQQLAAQQLAALETTLTGLLDSQRRVVEDVDRYEQLKQENAQLSRAQRLGLRNLAAQQELLATETRAIARGVRGLGVLTLALEFAADDMDRAAAQLDRDQTDAGVQATATRAATRLESLIQALAEEQSQPAVERQAERQPGQGGGEQSSGQQQAPQLEIAELKLLRAIQAELFEATRDFEQRIAERNDRDVVVPPIATAPLPGQPPTAVPAETDFQKLSEADRAEYERIGREQAKLAELVENITTRLRQE